MKSQMALHFFDYILLIKYKAIGGNKMANIPNYSVINVPIDTERNVEIVLESDQIKVAREVMWALYLNNFNTKLCKDLTFSPNCICEENIIDTFDGEENQFPEEEKIFIIESVSEIDRCGGDINVVEDVLHVWERRDRVEVKIKEGTIRELEKISKNFFKSFSYEKKK